ncbi:MAG: superoxide dismutase [Armatimonadetes bacterium]|nr:superoxide dismutase [Armatimonadota bacterium]
MPFELPPLPYAYNALEPHIDEMTMRIHHDRHHGTYVTNLNKALESAPDLQNKTVEDLLSNLNAVPESIRTAVRNNGGGHYNHTMFWEIMKPGGPSAPGGDLAQAINATFGSIDKLKETVNNAGLARFGSGWAWMVLDKDGKLAVVSAPNQDCPLMDGQKPVLGVDVWEHAYYLKYQNRRADYLQAWWNVVNWAEVGARYEKARKR